MYIHDEFYDTCIKTQINEKFDEPNKRKYPIQNKQKAIAKLSRI